MTRTVTYVISVVYLILLVKLILFKGPLFFRVVPTTELYRKQSERQALKEHNFIPFHTIKSFLSRDKIDAEILFNILGNILLFIPLGFLLPLCFRTIKASKVVLIVALTSISFELFQYITNTGVCDIDDFILNTTGGIIGYLLFTVFFKMTPKQNSHKQTLKSG